MGKGTEREGEGDIGDEVGREWWCRSWGGEKRTIRGGGGRQANATLRMLFHSREMVKIFNES